MEITRRKRSVPMNAIPAAAIREKLDTWSVVPMRAVTVSRLCLGRDEDADALCSTTKTAIRANSKGAQI